MTARARLARAAGLAAVIGAAVPQWWIAASYRPPPDPTETLRPVGLAIERGPLDEHVDLPATPELVGSASLRFPAGQAGNAVRLVVPPGSAAKVGAIVAWAPPGQDAEPRQDRPVLMLRCNEALADARPGDVGASVRCVHEELLRQGHKIDPAEVNDGRLGATTQTGLVSWYESAGATAPATDVDLELKRLEAETSLLEARRTLQTTPTDDKLAVEIADLRVEAATRQRDRLRDESGVMIRGAELLGIGAAEATVEHNADADGSSTIKASWGDPVIAVDVPAASVQAATGAVTRLLRWSGSGSEGLPLAPLDVVATADGGRRIRLRAVEGSVFPSASEIGASPVVRFVLRASAGPVLSVPEVALEPGAGDGSYVTVRSHGVVRRVEVAVVDRIAGRAVLAENPDLDGLSEVLVR